MSIHSSLANSGLLRRYESLASSAAGRSRHIPPLVGAVTMVVLSLMLIIFSVLTVARKGAIPEILDPPRFYLPGNSLSLLPKDAKCNHLENDIVSCMVHESGQDIYLSYESGSRRIIRTAIPAQQYKIGDLITEWGYPTGFTRHNTFIFVSWGTRSAVVYTPSFRPESRVEFIQYDFDPQTVSPWQGFFSSKSVAKAG